MATFQTTVPEWEESPSWPLPTAIVPQAIIVLRPLSQLFPHLANAGFMSRAAISWRSWSLRLRLRRPEVITRVLISFALPSMLSEGIVRSQVPESVF
jgi:hypothetical protein